MTTTNKSRRILLKSIAVGGGVVVAGKTIPDTWKKPVIDSVMLPAHAQTSGDDFAGLYSTQNSDISRSGTGSGTPGQVAKGLGRRLLGWLVPATHADHVLEAICLNEYNLVFQIPPGSDPRTVQICVETSQSRTSASTSITGNSLSNITIPLVETLAGSCEANDEALVLTNMTVGPNGVSGNLEAVEDGNEVACNDTSSPSRQVAASPVRRRVSKIHEVEGRPSRGRTDAASAATAGASPSGCLPGGVIDAPRSRCRVVPTAATGTGAALGRSF